MRLSAEININDYDPPYGGRVYFGVTAQFLWWHLQLLVGKWEFVGAPARVRIFVGSTRFYLRLHSESRSVKVNEYSGKVVQYYTLSGAFWKWGQKAYV